MSEEAFDLFSYGLARNSDPVHSHKAGASTNRARTRALILRVLPDIQPATDEQLVTACAAVEPCTPSGVRSRRKEMATEGLIVQDEDSVTSAGRACRTWRLV